MEKPNLESETPVKICIAKCAQTVSDNGMVTVCYRQYVIKTQHLAIPEPHTICHFPKQRVLNNAIYCQIPALFYATLTASNLSRHSPRGNN